MGGEGTTSLQTLCCLTGRGRGTEAEMCSGCHTREPGQGNRGQKSGEQMCQHSWDASIPLLSPCIDSEPAPDLLRVWESNSTSGISPIAACNACGIPAPSLPATPVGFQPTWVPRPQGLPAPGHKTAQLGREAKAGEGKGRAGRAGRGRERRLAGSQQAGLTRTSL